MNSLKDELKYLFSGQGMPYEKVSLMVAVAITVILTVLLGNNFIKDANIAVIDIDNSKYSHELIDKINSSTYMKVSTVINTPTDPATLFYQDANVAVLYLPQNLEKDFYSGQSIGIGIFYDNTNSAQSSGIKAALSEIIADENQRLMPTQGDSGGILLNARNLFNPAGSTSNSQTQGFLFFFSSMYFVFATIGMIPRLRLSGALTKILENGTPFDILIKLIPYGGCLITAFFIGMAILRIWGDMVFSGSILTFIFTQIFYVFVLGTMSLLMGWTASNPGIASSRMILFIPGGFILGGPTSPVPILSEWVFVLSHIFPLTWEFHFVRDVISRGARFFDIADIFGAFLLYIAAVFLVFCLVFYKARKNLLAQKYKEKNELAGEQQ